MTLRFFDSVYRLYTAFKAMRTCLIARNICTRKVPFVEDCQKSRVSIDQRMHLRYFYYIFIYLTQKVDKQL